MDDNKDKLLKCISVDKTISYAQNNEDIILWRALSHIKNGFYIDVGAAWPDTHSVTKLFYENGWRGINIEPNSFLHKKLERARVDDINLNIGISDSIGELDFYQYKDLGLSNFQSPIVGQNIPAIKKKVPVTTLNKVLEEHLTKRQEIHFLKIDVEGFEKQVLNGLDLAKYKPWIVICEATEIETNRLGNMDFEEILLSNGYKFVYFDQLNCFYISNEQCALQKQIALPPSHFDNFFRIDDFELFSKFDRDNNKELQDKLFLLKNRNANIEEELESNKNRNANIEEELESNKNKSQNELLLLNTIYTNLKEDNSYLQNNINILKNDLAFQNAKIINFSKIINYSHLRLIQWIRFSKAKLFLFISTKSWLQWLRDFSLKYPYLREIIRNYLTGTHNRKKENFEEITISGLKIFFHLPPTYDTRGIGRISRKILDNLREMHDSLPVHDQVYYYPALNFSSGAIFHPSVVMVHDLIPLFFKDLFPKEVIKEWEIDNRLSAVMATHLITISNSSKNDLFEKYKINKNKITTVYNAVSKLEDTPNEDVLEKKTTSSDRPYFVTLGASDYHKNIEILINIWTDNNDISEKYDLKIIGNSSPILGKTLNKTIKYLGQLKDKDVSRVIRNSEALLFPSLKEGFGLPPFEAALLDIPSICSARPAMTEVLKNAALFVEATDSEAWKAAIRKISGDKITAKRIAKKAKEIAINLNAEKNTHDLLKVFKQASSPIHKKINVLDSFAMESIEFLYALEGFGKIIVPNNFLSYFPQSNALPYTFGYFTDLSTLDVILIHKDEIDFLSTKLLIHMQNNMHYAFGNSVFNVFTRTHVKEKLEQKHLYPMENILENRFFEKNLFSKNSQRKIAIISAYGMGNIGDDLISLRAKSLLEQTYPEATIKLLPLPFSREKYSSYDTIVLGGGGVLYDADILNAINYTNILLYADDTGKECFGIGLGTQGIRSDIGKVLFREALNKTKFLNVRNEKDKTILQEIGVEVPIHTTEDLVFSLPISKNSWDHKSDQPIALISIMDTHNFLSDLISRKRMMGYSEMTYHTVKYLAQTHKLKFLCQSLDDKLLYQELSKEFGGEIITIPLSNIIDSLNYYAAADLVVTSRFHGLILAILHNKPLIAFGSNGLKIERLINTSFPSLKDSFISIQNIDIEIIEEKIKDLNNNPKKYTANAKGLEEAVKRSNSTLDILKKYVNEKPCN